MELPVPNARAATQREGPGLPAAAAELFGRRLLVQTGKGGVGKSSVTAALALMARRRGKRVLVCEVNGGGRIPALLGVPAGGPRVVEALPGLFCVDVRPHEAMIEYGLMKLKSAALVNAVLENRVMRYFLKALPTLAEVVTMGKILFHVREQAGGRPRFDLVLVDAPATGHCLALLRVPATVLATVPEGPLRDDLRWMAAMLEDPAQTAVNIVSLPEELPIDETLELAAALRAGEIPMGVCFLNAIWPSRFSAAEFPLLPDDVFWRPVRETVRRMEARADLCAVERRRLVSGLDLPVVDLPHVCVERFGREAVESLSRAAEQGLDATAALREARP